MSRPRIVIVGAGFAGYRTAKELSRKARGKADITLLNPTDYFLYLPLLPQVAAGILEPRRVTVSLSDTLPRVRLVLGEADGIDLDGRTVHYTDPEGGGGTLGYDRLVLAAGSVNKLLPIPGVAEHAHGFRGLPEALYLRDHVTRQVELAAAADDPATCAARCTFVVVGAGYTGTEVAAHGQLFTDAQVRRHPLRKGMRPRWLLLDVAERVLPELDEHLSRTADRTLRERGVEVRMGTSVKEATPDGVLLTDGEFVETRSLVWCVGVRPDPLAESLGLPMERGRLLVDPNLQVPGRPEVFACGDAAAVPDLENPGQFTPMTAQHAWRQGRTAALNVAASLGAGARRPYEHRDLGFVVDLGGVKAAANPLGVPLSGLAAGAVTRGYHLAAMPGNRVRVAADWLLDAVLPRQAVQLGLVRSWSVPLDTASPELARVPGRPQARQEADARSGPGAATEQETRPGQRPTERAAPPASAVERAERGEPAVEQVEPAVPAVERAESGEPVVERAERGEPVVGQVEPAVAAVERADARELAVERADAREPTGERADAREPTVMASAGEAVISEAKAREAAEQESPERRLPERELLERNAPGQESSQRQAPEQESPERWLPERELLERNALEQEAPERPAPEQKSPEQKAPEPATNQPGGESAKSRSAREPAKSQPGGEPAKSQPAPEPAKSQPGPEPAKSRPAPEPAKSQPDGEPAQAPGPVKRTDADPAEGDS
ncbi:NADH dehydrogenase [Streptomyces canus]|uniref:NADH dehydrogenase n=1 Tax=Streptomyces canus TaxID=58343 RepID=A0AAW8F8M2_9ACTN|nr:NAD(P)/FAD-dependent oxidoreductase [Streptomyces canus]MDQ0906466.1 NADH dehydrogenase [Streptomyces canus]